MPEVGPVVDVDWLRTRLEEPNIRVVEMRWYLKGPPGYEGYLAGHLPGAVFVDLERITGEGLGRHPLPTADDFAEAMREAGLSRDHIIIVYDDVSGSVAARLWWLLRYFGHERAAVLDGGLDAWHGPLEAGVVTPERGDFVSGPGGMMPIVDFDEVVGRPEASILLDARASERFRGETEPVDPRAGHIPGASSLPWNELVGERGRLLPATALRERFAGLGVSTAERTICYCGSGVTSCHLVLAIEHAGLGVPALYPGSWSEWCARNGPVAVGV